jgi:hypothetical protein
LFEWKLLLTSALSAGLFLSLALAVIMFASFALAPDMWVGDYPPDIREKYGPMSATASRLRPFVAVLFFVAVIALPILNLLAFERRVASVSFFPALAFSAIALLVFNAFDLLILDWLLFCTIRPRWLVLPGTEGMAGYRDFRFHFIGFLKGLGFCGIGALLISGAWLAIQAMIPYAAP